MVCDGEYGVKASRFREFGDEVEGDCFEGKGVLWFDWVEGASPFHQRLFKWERLCSWIRGSRRAKLVV